MNDESRRREADRGSNTTRPKTTHNSSSRLLQMATLVNVLRPNSNNEEQESQRHRNDLVETDGTTHNGRQEPPGQRAKYIMFGNYWMEAYRQSTFKDWCHDYPVDPVKLAAVGFCYTGFKDRVKCFSCGISVENWVIGDDPTHPRWHKTDCKMANETEERNVPSNSTVMKKMFRQFFSSVSPTPSNRLPTPCGLEQRSMNQQSHTAGVLVAESTQAIQLEASRPQATHQSPESLFRLAPINCPEHENLLYSLNLSRESDRRKTFVKWPSYPAPLLPGKLARSGLFYLGNLDRTQCFSCGGILRNWSAEDDPMSQHRRLFPNCGMVTGTETRNVPMVSSERSVLDNAEQRRHNMIVSALPVAPPDPSPNEQTRLARFFPCLNPANSHMCSEATRVASFTNSWPANKTKVTPREIAKAGFFFLGQGDRTKCFYCNGGLQHWDQNDEPWTEHAKWFPGCEFVLRNKGVRFVHRLKEENPNLNRPAIRNGVSYDIAEFSAPDPSDMEIASEGSAGALEENRRAEEALAALQRENLCKKCYRHTADQLCLPCSHFALCSFCKTDKCPICNMKVNSCLKVYRN